MSFETGALIMYELIGSICAAFQELAHVVWGFPPTGIGMPVSLYMKRPAQKSILLRTGRRQAHWLDNLQADRCGKSSGPR